MFIKEKLKNEKKNELKKFISLQNSQMKLNNKEQAFLKEIKKIHEESDDVVFGNIEDIINDKYNDNDFENSIIKEMYKTIKVLIDEANEIEKGYIKNIREKNRLKRIQAIKATKEKLLPITPGNKQQDLEAKVQ